jgi:transketolase
MQNNKERILQISFENKLSHIGSCLTALPIIEEIYAIKKPDEKFVLSSGHAHLAHAVVMAEINNEDPMKYMKAGIHCDKENGCDVSTGSLGQGLPIALGLAIGDRNKNVYCLISDGESAEGSIWEALRLKNDLGIKNLKVYANLNGWGAYQHVDPFILTNRLLEFCKDIQIRYAKKETAEYLQGLEAHYHVLTEEEYGKIKP